MVVIHEHSSCVQLSKKFPVWSSLDWSEARTHVRRARRRVGRCIFGWLSKIEREEKSRRDFGESIFRMVWEVRGGLGV